MPITLSGDGITSDNITSLAASKLTGQVPDANAPSGSVIQVQSVIVTDQLVFNTGSEGQTTHYSITGFDVSITPRASSSKVLLIAQVTTGQYSNGYNAYYSFFRDSTKVGAGSYQNSASDISGAGFRAFNADDLCTMNMTFLDSPNTTSAISYSVRVRPPGGSGYPSYLNRAAAPQGWHSGCSSTLTVLEIAA